MSINATTSSVSSTSQVNSSSGTTSAAQKSSSDTSFKEQMEKVSTAEDKQMQEKDASAEIAENAKEKDNVKSENSESSLIDKNKDNNEPDLSLSQNLEYSKFASLSMLDANNTLSNDIKEMITTSDVFSASQKQGSKGFDVNNSISMTQTDAEFFLNLTQTNDISAQNVITQAQNLLNSGADVKEVAQSVKISETLLNAINTAKETNQPLRIDFDQNVAVILRINKEGVVSANFIPGDKAVEQYLKNNISNLRATFEEQDLPYSDLSYSNRGSKQQKERQKQNNK